MEPVNPKELSSSLTGLPSNSNVPAAPTVTPGVAHQKFNVDVILNLASVVVLGVSGVLLNILVGRFYGPEALGVFNQVLSLFIVFSQLGVFGFHYSVLKHLAEHREDARMSREIVWHGLLLALLFGALTILIAYASIPLIRLFFRSDLVVAGWVYVVPGVLIFALNKVLLATLNGLEHMRLFAFFQCLRYVMMIVALICFVVFQIEGRYLPCIITITEAIVLLALLPVTLPHATPPAFNLSRDLLRLHLAFGSKSYLSGASVELNSKVDVLILGLFANDRLVGIYTMVALFLEGLVQLSVAVRNTLNPVLTRLYVRKEYAQLGQMFNQIKTRFFLFSIGMSLAIVLVYPFFIQWIVGDATFLEGFWPLAIMVTGFVLASPYLPLNMILMQAGFPGYQTIYNGLALKLNIIFNLLLVPFLGLYGSALGTAIAVAGAVIILKVMTKRITGLTI